MLSHGPHALGESPHALQQRGLLQVVEDFLAIDDGVKIVQGDVEERREVVVLRAGGDRLHDLTEMQIVKAIGRFLRFPTGGFAGASKQDAVEGFVSDILRSRRDRCRRKALLGDPRVILQVEAVGGHGGPRYRALSFN